MLQQPHLAIKSHVHPENPLRDPAELRARDERLQSLSQFIAQLAHALNNSLAPMTGYVALLGEELGKTSPSHRYLAKLEDSMRKTEEVVRALLQAAHPERQFVAATADLAALVRQTTERWSRTIPERRRIAVTLDLAAACELTLDESLWARAILELLRNAELAMARGGTLRIQLEKRALSPNETEVLGFDRADCCCLVFEDSGCGMTREAVEKAFDPLFTTRHHASTAGLGLYLVHGVVRLHGGQVTLTSTPNRGTAVRIWLPVPRPTA
jgi:signal transduction histidine kinase